MLVFSIDVFQNDNVRIFYYFNLSKESFYSCELVIHFLRELNETYGSASLSTPLVRSKEKKRVLVVWITEESDIPKSTI